MSTTASVLLPTAKYAPTGNRSPPAIQFWHAANHTAARLLRRSMSGAMRTRHSVSGHFCWSMVRHLCRPLPHPPVQHRYEAARHASLAVFDSLTMQPQATTS
jgi:hypothetical protein